MLLTISIGIELLDILEESTEKIECGILDE